MYSRSFASGNFPIFIMSVDLAAILKDKIVLNQTLLLMTVICKISLFLSLKKKVGRSLLIIQTICLAFSLLKSSIQIS